MTFLLITRSTWKHQRPQGGYGRGCRDGAWPSLRQ